MFRHSTDFRVLNSDNCNLFQSWKETEVRAEKEAGDCEKSFDELHAMCCDYQDKMRRLLSSFYKNTESSVQVCYYRLLLYFSRCINCSLTNGSDKIFKVSSERKNFGLGPKLYENKSRKTAALPHLHKTRTAWQRRCDNRGH